jgi:hypothetical protein
VRGTASYWKDQLYDLLAKMKTLGPPDVLLTLSVDDNHWDELRELLEEEEDMSILGNMSEFVKKNPVVVAQYARLRFQAELEYVRKSKCLGTVTDHHCRIEFQNRGSVHFHCFLWISDAKSTFKNSSSEEILEYIDKVISTKLPDKDTDQELYELVKSRQFHKHTETCKKSKGKTCRFHFPKSTCDATRLLFEYEQMRKRGAFYETKRPAGCENLNNYNESILRRWRANMDIQLVNGHQGLAYYVCKYCMKAEPEELKTKLSEEIQRMNAASVHQRTRMLKLGMCMLKHRRMTAQEAAYRICGFEMVVSSRTTMLISTLPEEKRVKKLKKLSEVSGLNPDSRDVFYDNILDTYRKRPAELDNLSFHQFASWYAKVSNETKGKKLLSLNDESAKIRKRTQFKCLRTSRVSVASDGYYYSLLVQHLPHRTEHDLKGDYTTYKEAFEQNNANMNLTDLTSDVFVNEVIEQCRRMQVSRALAERYNDDSGEENMDDDNDMDTELFDQTTVPSTSATVSATNPTDVLSSTTEALEWHSMMTGAMTEDELAQKITKLSRDQARCLKYVQQKIAKNEQILLMIMGNAGTGKSYLLEVIIDWLRLNQAQLSGNDPVLIGAPTGLAAKNIGGRTLHSLLKLPVRKRTERAELLPLSARVLEQLRSQIGSKRYMIVDEISMVGHNMINFMHKRLVETKKSDDSEQEKLFGGMNMIVAGDFFQLKPIGETYCFKSMLFDPFECIWLEQNMRQRDDQEWCNLLDRIRMGELTDQDRATLESRVITNRRTLNELTVDMRLYPTIKQVTEYNSMKQRELTGTVTKIASIDLYSVNDNAIGCSAEQCDIPDDDRDAGGLPRELLISEGTRIMLIRNLSKDLVNGDMGYCRQIEHDEHRCAVKVYVAFDNPELGTEFQDGKYGTSVCIERIETEFHHHGRFINRRQFPLMQSWSVTIHKSQGMSLTSGMVHIGYKIFDSSQIYVALSRFRSLAGLHIDGCEKGDFINSTRLKPNEFVMDWCLKVKQLWKVLKRKIDRNEL